MITINGREALLRYLTGENPSWAGTIIVGIGRTPADVDDERMEFQIGEAAIDVALANVRDNTITVKGTLPVGVAGIVSELGINTRIADPGTGASRLLTTFDSTLEPIAGATPSDSYTRVGTESASISVPASTAGSISIDNIDMDLSAYESHDEFALAYHQVGTNAAGLEVQLQTDDSNYFTMTVPLPIVAGYKILTFTKGSFVAVGQPDWGSISRMTFTVTASAGGAAAIHFDGFRINNRDDNEGMLVAREVMADENLVTKDLSQELDIEMTLVFNFGT